MSGSRGEIDDKTRSLALDEPVAGPLLVALWDGGQVRVAIPPGGRVVIGRGNDCDVQIVHASLSRRHLAIEVSAQCTVTDLGSTHGTQVGGRTLRGSESAVIPPGGVVEAGPISFFLQNVANEGATAPSTRQGAERLEALVAKSRLSVLLFGETGVGKEVAADRIHAASARAAGPLVKINCAALPEPLLESELFGHERGAFTGADRQKVGLIQTADGGTLFLDEVSELPLATQSKLLRFLENKEVRRVGGLTSTVVDVRVIAATNRDLRVAIKERTFREDLYYRLNGMTLALKPLRERKDEVPELAAEFIRRQTPDGANVPTISREALAMLGRHSWPGNIRELRIVIERALVLSDGADIEAEHIMLDPSPGEEGASAAGGLRDQVSEFERRRVVEALDAAGGNQTKAAAILGITRRALILKLEAYQLPRPRKK